MDDPRFSTRLAKLASSNRYKDEVVPGDDGDDEGSVEVTRSHKRGVLYFSSIPTNMRPNEVRLHFGKFGELLRQKFVPFPKKVIGNGRSLAPLQFKEGYLEFLRYEDAKKAADIMNMSFIGCKRFRKAHGQKWNVRLLDKFSWDTLVETREEELRDRKYKEFKAKEHERSSNEHFRQMLSLKRARCSAPDAVPCVTEEEVSRIPRRDKSQVKDDKTTSRRTMKKTLSVEAAESPRRRKEKKLE